MKRLWFLVFSLLSSLAAAQTWPELYDLLNVRGWDAPTFHTWAQGQLTTLQGKTDLTSVVQRCKVYYLQGLVEMDYERMSDADRYLTLADKEVERWVRLSETSESMRHLVEIRTMLMMTKGLLYTIANALSLASAADRALALDPQDPRAQLLIAIKMCYAPFFAGGDSVKGRERLLALSQHPKMDKQGQFIAFFELASSWKREGKKNLALDYIQKCFVLYPGNMTTRLLLREMDPGLEAKLFPE